MARLQAQLRITSEPRLLLDCLQSSSLGLLPCLHSPSQHMSTSRQTHLHVWSHPLSISPIL